MGLKISDVKRKLVATGVEIEKPDLAVATIGNSAVLTGVCGEIPAAEEIEQFIIDVGSDNVSVFGGKYEGGVHCQQVPDEFAACIKFILDAGEKIRNYLEIGVSSGGTTYICNHFFKPEKIVLIDNNRHWKVPLRTTILKDVDRTEVVGNSNDSAIIEQARGEYDLIIIDGDHTYAGVSADARNYIPMARPGGYILFHDSVLTDWGILPLVKELRNDPSVELVAEFLSTKRAPLGIALFRKAAE